MPSDRPKPSPVAPADLGTGYRHLLRRATSLTPEERRALDERYTRNAQLAAWKEQAYHLDRLAAQLGPVYAPGKTTLDSFVLSDKQAFRAAQTAVLARLRTIMARVGDFVSECRGLILYGPVGTGKDHLLAAMLYAAARAGKRGGWHFVPRFLADVSDRFTASSTEELIMAPLCRYDVLVLSDPVPAAGDAARATDMTKLHTLLERRAHWGRPTWATLNALSPADAEAKLSPPVWDRLQYRAEAIHCYWPSFREAAHA